MTPPLTLPDVLEGRQTCSVLEGAELVGVSRRTIYNWMRLGKVEFVRTASGNPRIYVDSLWRAGTVARPVDTRLPDVPRETASRIHEEDR